MVGGRQLSGRNSGLLADDQFSSQTSIYHNHKEGLCKLRLLGPPPELPIQVLGGTDYLHFQQIPR